jgi:DNA-directed RNA polymerase subunit beta'
MKLNREMLEVEKILKKLENLDSSFDYLRIRIASPERIKLWAQRLLPHGEVVGEVLRPETINFRTHQTETYGLFCEKIFGPIKNWKCKCGKYNGFVFDKVCEDCHVEIIEARVRRYRMGYIDLTYPIAHFWYFKALPSYLTIILNCLEPNLKASELENILYFREDNNENSYFSEFQIIEEKNELKNFLKTSRNYYSNLNPQTRNGAELIKAALEQIHVKSEIVKGRQLLHKKKESTQDNSKLIRRIRILESFFTTETNLTWMILTVLPVLPPSLRPLLELENGRLVAADINEIYRLIIIRNQRLFDFRALFVPDVVTLHGKKLLQECIDSLIDNARVPKERKITLNNKPLKSLSEILEGKQGRFRQSLLGKRVDYSARSVIVVGPSLRLNQCGLPYQIGLELFLPFLINELLKTKIKATSYNTKLANIIIKKNKPFVWVLLTELTKKYSVLLNRAPTLHRFGIQAFDPVLILGQAIQLHPLVCSGFNADFDGDQMAVHLPLYESSQLEVRSMMRPSYNVLSPANGEVILKPTQDMVIGCYYLTLMVTKNKQLFQQWFPNENDALKAFYQKKINLHTPILVRYKIFNTNFEIEKNEIKVFKTKKNVFFKETEIFIYKKFQINQPLEKFYFITNLGVFVGYGNRAGQSSEISPTNSNQFTKLETTRQKYSLTDLFLETSPGRLIFSINFKNAIQ